MIHSSSGVILSRSRLLACLDREVPLCVLRAPTGFGKSVLVRQWLTEAAGEGQHVATLRVRSGEGDQNDFWISLVDALTDAGVPLPAIANGRSPQSLAARMISTIDRPLTVWIDNFENVTGEGVDEGLIDLATHVPDLRLIVGMRSFRDFAPHALREIPAVMLTAHDLLFTPEELAELFRLAGYEAADELAATVHEEVGGWPALVQELVEAIAVDTDDDLPTLMKRVTSRWLGELLPRIPNAGLIDFALASSIPGSITPELAGHVSSDESADTYLERLIAAGLLAPDASGAASESRWAPTARKALHDELERRDPGRLRTLSEHLGRWYAEQGRPAAALEHAIVAKAWRLVVGIIDEHWRTLMLHHREDLNRALLATPTEEFFATPEPTPSRAIRSIFLQLDEPTVNADILPTLPADLAELGASQRAPSAINTAFACLLALRTSARWAEAIELSNRIVTVADVARASRPGAVVDLYASVQFFAGETSLITGDVLTAVGRFELAFRRSTDGTFGYIEADAAAKLALTHAVHGNLPEATTWIQRHSRSVAAEPPTTWLAPYMQTSTNTARMLLATDRLDFAEASAAEATLYENIFPNILSTYELYARSLLAVSTRSAVDVLESIDRAGWTLGSAARPQPFDPLAAQIEADAHLALGHGNHAHRIANGPYRDHAVLQTTHARLALLAGDPSEALRLAKDTSWSHQASRRHRLEMLVIRAVAAHRTGDDALAASSLGRAVSTAEHTGMLRPFTTVPRHELLTLASRLLPAQRALIESSLEASGEIYPDSIALITLTRREQQVLDRIVAGQSIRQIAISLQITYSTVRTQQRSLYRKLDASDRLEAITHARRAGLISGG
ncbi:MAG: LuxR family transcriptional regulator, maltose regulon positive regulatory protein [Frondihabitans sp.]|nr:LuxR family transcriptional regulator, maltose regulon positive regulatory protein [Frondihabitans sp.]